MQIDNLNSLRGKKVAPFRTKGSGRKINRWSRIAVRILEESGSCAVSGTNMRLMFSLWGEQPASVPGVAR